MEGRTYVPAVRGWQVAVDNLATVPVVALGLGSVAGLGAARMAASHYSLLVQDSAQMFVAGPPVVARVDDPIEKNDLGGSDIHARTAPSMTRSPAKPRLLPRPAGFCPTCRPLSTICRRVIRQKTTATAARIG